MGVTFLQFGAQTVLSTEVGNCAPRRTAVNLRESIGADFMKKLVISAVAVVAFFGGSALAADIPVKGPVYKAVPHYNWTGWYGGLNAGYGWDPNYSVSSPGEDTEILNLEPKGGFFGFQVGYNWQYARNWLYGIEADFQFANLTDSLAFTAGGGGGNASSARIDIQNFGTIRGRFGYVNDRTLLFVTGGVAFANFDIFVNARYDTTVGNIDTFKWEVGYVVGAGIEHAFLNGWIGKIEYQFMDFSLSASATASNGAPITITGDPQIHIIKLGINRKFAGLLQFQ